MVIAIKNKFDLEKKISSLLYRMVFQKYNNDEERLAALRGQKNQYAKKPHTCEFCNVTILKGNKWIHSKSYKHEENIREISVKNTGNTHEVGQNE